MFANPVFITPGRFMIIIIIIIIIIVKKMGIKVFE